MNSDALMIERHVLAKRYRKVNPVTGGEIFKEQLNCSAVTLKGKVLSL